jgi:RHH-type proline utilization regulon transcriptional repressor/proline dehydrogenase/delta 1-pyrroline-5-carboxylate dehydrogenase
MFDMEQAETKDLILHIFKRLFSEPAYRSYPHAGLALQAYHRNTERDIQDLVGWVRDRGVPMTIRLVKGAYWDSDTVRYRQAGWPSPLFEVKAETDANYERLIPILFEHVDLIRPAFGTHNLRTLAAVEAHAESLGLAPEAREYQMIFGMAEPFQQAMVKMGRRVRLYTPVGRLLPGMAYLVRRLLENTSNESFLKKEYVESQPLTLLLAPPQTSTPHPSIKTMDHGHGFVNEPHGDFSQADVRDAMRAGIVSVQSQLGRRWEGRTSNLVLTGPWLESRNPCRPDEVVAHVQSAAVSDLDPIIDRVLRQWENWRHTAPEARSDILRKTAGEMSRRRCELASWPRCSPGRPGIPRPAGTRRRWPS